MNDLDAMWRDGALRRRDLAWANANSCAASGLAELAPPTCWDLCVSGSPQASPRRELIDPEPSVARARLRKPAEFTIIQLV